MARRRYRAGCHVSDVSPTWLFPLPFDHVVDRCVRRSVRSAVEAGRQELQERADRRHRIAAGRRVDELHLDAMAGMERAVSVHAFERLAAPRVRVREQRRGFPVALKTPAAADLTPKRVRRIAFLLWRPAALSSRVMLGEARVEHVDDRNIEAIHPDDRVSGRDCRDRDRSTTESG